MRIIWVGEFKRMFVKNLSPEELQWYQKASVTPRSLDEMRRQGDIQLPLFLKAIGCVCLERMKIFQEKCWEVFGAVYGEDVDACFTNHNAKGEMANQRYCKMLAGLSRQTARQRECHMHLRGFTCYCDEHKHL